jgi:hypothetical protein
MNEKNEYEATLDGEKISFTNDKGLLTFSLACEHNTTHRLIIKKK